MVSSQTILVAILWGAGMLVQAVLMLQMKLSLREVRNLLLCIIASFLGLIPGKNEDVYAIHFHIFLVLAAFLLLFAVTFKERILAPIDEYILLVWNLLALYVAVELFGASSTISLWAYILVTSITILLLTPWHVHGNARAILYVWYLLLVVSVGLAQFQFDTIRPFFDEARSLPLPPLTAFLGGMALLSVGVNVLYVFELIPIPGKRQTIAQRLRQLREFLSLLASRTSTSQSRLSAALFLLLIVGGGLTLNYIYQFSSSFVAVNLVIVAVPYVLWTSQRLFGGLFSECEPSS